MDAFEEKLHDTMLRLSAVEKAQILSDRNHTDIAQSLTKIVDDNMNSKAVLEQLKTDKAVREERDKNLDNRLRGIEASIQRMYNLGWWVLASFAGTLIVILTKFVIGGGLNIP